MARRDDGRAVADYARRMRAGQAVKRVVAIGDLGEVPPPAPAPAPRPAPSGTSGATTGNSFFSVTTTTAAPAPAPAPAPMAPPPAPAPAPMAVAVAPKTPEELVKNLPASVRDYALGLLRTGLPWPRVFGMANARAAELAKVPTAAVSAALLAQRRAAELRAAAAVAPAPAPAPRAVVTRTYQASPAAAVAPVYDASSGGGWDEAAPSSPAAVAGDVGSPEGIPTKTYVIGGAAVLGVLALAWMALGD